MKRLLFLIGSVALCAFGIFLISPLWNTVQAGANPASPTGFFPVVVGVILLLLGLVVGQRALRKKGPSPS
jgi:tetrahydromethanopterin S-methyltransferase subunit E